MVKMIFFNVSSTAVAQEGLNETLDKKIEEARPILRRVAEKAFISKRRASGDKQISAVRTAVSRKMKQFKGLGLAVTVEFHVVSDIFHRPHIYELRRINISEYAINGPR